MSNLDSELAYYMRHFGRLGLVECFLITSAETPEMREAWDNLMDIFYT